MTLSRGNLKAGEGVLRKNLFPEEYFLPPQAAVWLLFILSA